MALLLINLDEETRKFMLEEIARDEGLGTLVVSKRLSEAGIRDWPALIKSAAQQYSDAWLAHHLQLEGRLNSHEPRRNAKTGNITMVAVPYNANETLAEGEFNRFYARGLSLRAIAANIVHLEVYRAKAVSNPRPESEALIGTHAGTEVLLNDLRMHQGIDTALGIPAGPNSGLSVKLP